MANTEVTQLPPLADAIVDRAIDNVNRKLVGGHRNKKNSAPGANDLNVRRTMGDTFEAASAASVREVANRGVAWREMIQKSLSHGISSLSSMQFDGEFSVKAGVPQALDQVPTQPGVYVVYDRQDEAVYVGDSTNLRSRWHAGHINAYRQGKKSGDPYKLAQHFEEGCTVRFIKMDSEQTAAALEAHLIKTEKPSVNKREELKAAQGKRANIEAKKMKDASGSLPSLAAGASLEAAASLGWGALEQITAAVMKALKYELVDIVSGGTTKLATRLKRFLDRVMAALKGLFQAPLQLLAGVVEFVFNALSHALRQIYALARNLFDLGQAAWQLYSGAQSMSREQLVAKLTETIIISGTLVIWDALDPIMEAQLLPLTGPAAPFIAAAISAIGFGLSSFYLQKFVPGVVEFLLNCKSCHHEAVEAQRAACEQLIINAEREFEMVHILGEYLHSSRVLQNEVAGHIETLSEHAPVSRFDGASLLKAK